MVSDVPLGAFLSGGIDSSTVVALMQATSSPAGASTFTIGFPRRPTTRQRRPSVAQHLEDRPYRALCPAANTSATLIPSISEWFDEPFADSQIPTYLVSE